VLQKAEPSQAHSENNLEAPPRHMYFIGLDVHKRTISHSVKDAAGRVHQEGKIGSTRRELDGWIRTMPQPRTIAMEATISTGWIYDHLLPHAQTLANFFPCDQFAGFFQQKFENLDRLALQLQADTVLLQLSGLGVELERTETIDLLFADRHDAFRRTLTHLPRRCHSPSVYHSYRSKEVYVVVHDKITLDKGWRCKMIASLGRAP
jgi:hypothetical protein